MTSVKPTKRAATTAPGVKLLLTAASFAATIGGWALIGAKDNTAQKPVAPETAQINAAQIAAPQPSTELIIKLDPLPTLVPQPTPQSQLVTASNKPVAAARPANPQPVPAVPALRIVTAPSGGGGGGGGGGGAPVATTHSSK